MCVVPGPVFAVAVHNESVKSSAFTLTWMEISLTNSDLSHYTVFYLPVRGPYGPIMTSNMRKRRSAEAVELTMDFTGTTGTLTNLYGAVTYRVQLAAVVTVNGQEVTGDRSAAIEVTTLEGGKKILFMCISVTCLLIVPTDPRNFNYINPTNAGDMFNITLIWSRPDPPNGIITQYNVSNITDNYCL